MHLDLYLYFSIFIKKKKIKKGILLVIWVINCYTHYIQSQINDLGETSHD